VDGYALKMDARTNRLVGSVRVDRNPGDLVVSADGKTLYQTHFDVLKIAEVARNHGPESAMDARLAILDTGTMQRKAMVPVCPAPHAVRLSPDERRAYVACWSDELAVVQLDAPGYPVTRVKVAPNAGTAVAPRHQPYALTLSRASGAVWVSSLETRAVQYFDPVTQAMDPARTVFLRGSPMFGAVTQDGRTLYMPYQSVDALAVIDTATSAVVRDIPLAGSGCLNVHQVELTPDERHGLVVCEGDHQGPGSLLVVDLAEGAVVKSVTVGIFPDSVTLLRRNP
jgi:DNA-binding beta-propeller fold protein YncE